MIGEKLEIPIITYNRAEYLERTLAQFLESPFARCKFTVLDNCSTDHTADVCRKYASLLPDFHVIRHRVNIGLSANYLRAVEIVRTDFIWLLCDDDLYDFGGCADVLEAVESDRFDLISLGSPGQFDWERGLATTTQEVLRRGARYISTFIFASGVIFRTALFDSECMVKGYRNAANSYPQFPFIVQTVYDNRAIYHSERMVVHRDPHGMFGSHLQYWAVYMNSCRTIEDPALRRSTIYLMHGIDGRAAWVKALANVIVEAKLWAPDRFWPRILEVAMAFTWDQRLWLLLLSPLIVLPPGAYRLARRAWRMLRGKPSSTRLDPAEDLFRL